MVQMPFEKHLYESGSGEGSTKVGPDSTAVYDLVSEDGHNLTSRQHDRFE